jgi:hypothetical protein
MNEIRTSCERGCLRNTWEKKKQNQEGYLKVGIFFRTSRILTKKKMKEPKQSITKKS